MSTEMWLEKIAELPVWDTHTHLDGMESASAKSVWDIFHYFWFKRELEGVGYPLDPGEYDERSRAEALAKSLHKARNTYWAQAVRRGIRALWDKEVSNADSVLELDRRIRATALRRGWVDEVLDRAGVARIVIGDQGGASAKALGQRAVVVPPIYQFPPEQRIQEILDSTQQKHEIEELANQTEKQVADFVAQGRQTIRTPFSFVRDEGRPSDIPNLANYGNSARTIRQYLSHVLYHALEKHGCHVQLFVGMADPTPGYRPRSRVSRHHAQNDPRLISDMHDIFDMYSGCTFEIVNAAELSALDIVQAARIYGNVYPGGLWWFNFRASTYRANMQYRIEALPACRSMLVASDARCVEWCYIKLDLVKRLLADFLARQVEGGWLDGDAALYTARCWLHDSAAQVYS